LAFDAIGPAVFAVASSSGRFELEAADEAVEDGSAEGELAANPLMAESMLLKTRFFLGISVSRAAHRHACA
jgi:hypothetical protein